MTKQGMVIPDKKIFINFIGLILLITLNTLNIHLMGGFIF